MSAVITDRAALIEQILRRRRERADDLGVLLDAVDRLSRSAAALAAARDALAAGVADDGEAGAVLGSLADDVAEFRRRADAVRNDLERTEARFARPTLTVGAIGRSGQGKSTLLQSLTGLSDREIPSGAGSFMTGVPSYIRHTVGETTAEIEFHDGRSFLDEVIARYYPALGLGPVPAGLDEFAATPLPPMPATAGAAEEEAYRHLAQYHEHLAAYRDRLEGRIRVRPVPPDQIRGHVAQHDEHGAPAHGFRAVRTVRIATPFGRADIGRLTVVDLPGLGDTNLGDVELLNRALGGEVDVALFVKRPDRMRYGVDDADVALYDLARAALPELPLERWSFLLVNRLSGAQGNGPAAAGYREKVAESRLRYADVVEADCQDPDDVAHAFDVILGHLVTGVDDLDQTLTARRAQDVATLCQEASVLASQARAVAKYAVPEASWHPRFLELFAPVYEELAGALEDLVADYRLETTTPDPELGTAVGDALRLLGDQGGLLPTEAEIESRRGPDGAYAAVLADSVNELRAAISRRFLELDGALKNRVDAMHRDVAGVLAGAGRLGALGGGRAADAADAADTADPADPATATATASADPGRPFLALLDELLPVHPLTGDLGYGLRFVRDYTLNYRGLLQHRVRRALAKLDPDAIAIPAGTRPEDIRYMLEEYLGEAVFDIEGELEPVLIEPREAVFAVVEEFRDRALRVPHARDGWQVMYESVRTEVWPDEFEALAANTALYQRWRAAVEEFAAAAKPAASADPPAGADAPAGAGD